MEQLQLRLERLLAALVVGLAHFSKNFVARAHRLQLQIRFQSFVDLLANGLHLFSGALGLLLAPDGAEHVVVREARPIFRRNGL